MQRFAQALLYVTFAGLAAAACSAAGSTKSTSATTQGAGGAANTSSGHGGAATGGSGGGNSGQGGSTGVFITGVSSSSGGTCQAFKSCVTQGVTCGTTPDGCGNILKCGSCPANESCESGKCVATCTPKTCAEQGFDCGMATDTCGGAISCGATCPTGESCGAQSPNKCGTGGNCTPKTCVQLGFSCGMQGDTCGGTIDCGSCPNGDTCGANSMPGKCVSTCAAKTCTSQGFNCGMATDGCGNTINCGACPTGEVCGTGGPNQCGSGVPCTGLCLQQTTCPGSATTSISGSVYAPNGVDVLPGALVYVPNSAVQPFTQGVSCGTCGSDVSGSPLVSTVSAFDGTFTITNMPVGKNIPLVIQKGRWRRQFTIPNVASCVNTPLPTTGAGQIRMPRTDTVHAGGEGDIPLQAFVTGSVDALECVLRKIGIADSEFSDPSGTGRVRFYLGDGGPGASYSGSTPVEDTLWSSAANIDKYDIVYFACQGDDYEKTLAQQQVVVDYANAGGRVFATHYSYVWLTNTANNAVWSPTATWNIGVNEGTVSTDPATGTINTGATDPRPNELAQWLQFIGASTTFGQMQIQTLRNDFTVVNPPALLWITIDDMGFPPFFPGLGVIPMHMTFDTPLGAAPANQCGRVLYSDFHVEDATTGGTTFPQECTDPTMTPQEKMLEFMIFDLGSCVNTKTTCTPLTCGSQNITCGAAGDGCGNIIQCGTCPSGESCIAGTCANACTPQTCASQHYTCGMQGDGCGNTLSCGMCPSGMNCNSGTCTNQGCTPKTTCPAGANCGSVSDGCSGTINCGTCTAPETCGGGGTPNQCGEPKCTPKNCTQQGFNCGMATDGCGNTINCGTCTSPQTCGGGQPAHANVCGGGSG